VRQHEGSKLIDRKTRREAAALLSVLAQLTAKKEKRPAGSAPDAQGFVEMFQRVGKESLRFGRKPNPKWPPSFEETGVGWRAGKSAYIFVIFFCGMYAIYMVCG
jgi:hypothetical protein